MTEQESHGRDVESERARLSSLLLGLAHDTSRTRISVGELLGALQDRALAALVFVFAIPNVLPVPPGTSAFLGAPLIFLTAQLALGRSPWLPGFITQRTMAHADFASWMTRIAPWLARAEKLLRPRLAVLTLPPMEFVLGLVSLFLALVVMLPIPLGNTLPSLAVGLIALGILERDGLWVIGGLVTGAVALFVVSGMLFATLEVALYFVTHLFA